MTSRAHAVALGSHLAAVDPSRIDRFADGSVHEVFRQLRREAPVHFCADSAFGPYWSICNYKDIVEIEALPLLYSSATERGGISIIEANAEEAGMFETFIAMDPPRHAEKRRVVAPAFGPSEMTRLSASITERTADCLDGLPRGEMFDWVSSVSVALTTDMLATLFDFPWEQRGRLAVWSDAITSLEMIRNQPQERFALVVEMGTCFHQLWQQRSKAAPAPDLLSMMIHSSALGDMSDQEFIGNMMLLIVGGNDTTRNSMSGLVDAFTRWPDQWDQIVANPSLIPNAASEIIRWQSPVAHMRRTVVEDVVFRGQQFRAGDKIVMWYLSGNRDEAVFPDGDRFIADRDNARRHLSFGYGVHRCVGARLAELQVQALLTGMVDRGLRIESVGDIVREQHPFISSIKTAPVRILAG